MTKCWKKTIILKRCQYLLNNKHTSVYSISIYSRCIICHIYGRINIEAISYIVTLKTLRSKCVAPQINSKEHIESTCKEKFNAQNAQNFNLFGCNVLILLWQHLIKTGIYSVLLNEECNVAFHLIYVRTGDLTTYYILLIIYTVSVLNKYHSCSKEPYLTTPQLTFARQNSTTLDQSADISMTNYG